MADVPFSWRLTAPLYIGSALNPINSSMIATALVPIADDLHIPVGQTAALVSALYLASAVAQPTAGRVAAVYGPRRVFLAGVLLVLLGGALGAVAHDVATLVVARVLIGSGTSCAYPTSMMLVQRRAAEAGADKPPGSVLGGLQIAGIATASLGLPVGGVVVETIGWQGVFLVNVPVALVALVAAVRWIPHDPMSQMPRGVRELGIRIDVAGVVCFAVAMTALLVFLSALRIPHWYVLALSVGAFAALVWWELRAEQPFIDVRMLVRNSALTRTYLRYALVALCVYVVLYGVTQWFQAGRGMSALASGLLLLPMSVVSGVVVAPVSRRNLVRGSLIGAALAALLGSVGLLVVSSGTPVPWIVAITVVFGVALGAAAGGNQLALYAQAPVEQLGVASGLFRTFGYVGSIASAAITGTVFHADVSDGGLHRIASIMIGVSVVAVALSFCDRALRDSSTPAQRR